MLVGLERYLLAITGTICVFIVLHVAGFLRISGRKGDDGAGGSKE